MEQKKKKRLHPEPVTVGDAVVRIYWYQKKRGAQKYNEFKVADITRGKRVFHTFSQLNKAQEKAHSIARSLSDAFTKNEKLRYLRAINALKPTSTPLDIAASQFAEAAKIVGSNQVVEAAKYYARLKI